jgi:hypothetical protein
MLLLHCSVFASDWVRSWLTNVHNLSSMFSKDVSGLTAWFEDGKTLGVAVDVEKGILLVCATSTAHSQSQVQWLTAAENLSLTSVGGKTLFPAISGQQGACVRFNFGHDPVNRPFKIGPPSADFQSLAAYTAAAGGHQV